MKKAGKVIKLAATRSMLLATHASDGRPFEVSRWIDVGPLLAKCQAAPTCAGSEPLTRSTMQNEPDGCPYAFATRGQCGRTLNQLALERALFVPSEAKAARRVLESMNFEVEKVVVDVTLGDRVLIAHGGLGPNVDARKLDARGVGSLCMARAK